MGFYSIYKIFKDMIRTLFGKHFLKFIIILVFILLGYIVFSCEGVFAQTSIVVNDIFTTEDISVARNLVGESIWNNTDYDIYLVWGGSYWRNGSYIYNNNVSDLKYGKYVYYFDTTNSNVTDNNFKCSAFSNTSQYGFTWRGSWFSKYPDIFPQTLKLLYWPNNNVRERSSDGLEIQSDILNSDVIYFKPIRMRYDLIDNNDNIIVSHNYSDTVNPFIVNDTQDIENWSFDKLSINLGTYDPYYTYIDFRTLKTFDLIYTYKDTNYTINVDSYLHQVSGQYFIDIPVNALTNSVNIRNDSDISFILSAGGRFIETDYFELGTYSLGLTSEEEEQINQDSEKYVQSQILQEQQKTNENLNNINNNINNTNEKLDNLDNTINNSNVDNITSDTLPSDNTQDITADGVNGIFTSIYNAFCTGNAQDIVFPIPFTGKDITLSSNYVINALNSSGAGFIITLIQAFWWYLISRFIIKDIMNKINKIKSGNIEDIETTNIRGDML